MFLAKVLLILLSTHLSYANEAAEPAAGVSEADSVYSGKQNEEWANVQKRLAEMKAKLEAQDTLVKNLIIAKVSAPGDEQIKKSAELQVEHHKLQKMIADYNELSNDYETKFPEKGIKEKRIYKRVDAKSIQGIEKDLTLEGRLTKLHGKVLSQYNRSAPTSGDATKAKDKKDSKQKKAPIAKPAPSPEKDITEQIILSK